MGLHSPQNGTVKLNGQCARHSPEEMRAILLQVMKSDCRDRIADIIRTLQNEPCESPLYRAFLGHRKAGIVSRREREEILCLRDTLEILKSVHHPRDAIHLEMLTKKKRKNLPA